MFLASAHALALGTDRRMIINGVIAGNPKDQEICEYVNKFALCRCLVSGETDEVISVTLYEDEDE